MKDSYLYQQLADELASAIRHGDFQYGDKLPSIRSICADHSVSLATAVQAYEVLQQNNLIEARPKKGYFVRFKLQQEQVPMASKPSMRANKVSVAQLAMSLVQESRHPSLLRLGAAVPGPDLMPLAQLARIQAGVARRFYHSAATYPDEQGDIGLRREIAMQMRDAGCRIQAADVVITNGCLEALGLALRCVAKTGDVIAIESPTYFGILRAIENLGMKVLELPTSSASGVDLDALEKALKRGLVKACAFQPSYSNPFGSCMPDAHKQRLMSLLNHYQVPLIEDDEYGFLSFSSRRPKAAKAYDKEQRVIYCSSFSKTISPALRLGWMIPGLYTESVVYQKFLDNISTAIHPQLTMAEILQRGLFKRSVRHAANVYRVRLRAMQHWIEEFFPTGTRVTQPQGGFVLWIQLPQAVNALELYQLAMKQRIAITPGILFSTHAHYSNCIRVSAGVVEGESARLSLQKLGKMAQQLGK